MLFDVLQVLLIENNKKKSKHDNFLFFSKKKFFQLSVFFCACVLYCCYTLLIKRKEKKNVEVTLRFEMKKTSLMTTTYLSLHHFFSVFTFPFFFSHSLLFCIGKREKYIYIKTKKKNRWENY